MAPVYHKSPNVHVGTSEPLCTTLKDLIFRYLLCICRVLVECDLGKNLGVDSEQQYSIKSACTVWQKL